MGISTSKVTGARKFRSIGLNSRSSTNFLPGLPAASRASAWKRSPKSRFAATNTPIPHVGAANARSRRRRPISMAPKGEAHIFNPDVIARLQQSVRINSREEFRKFCQADRRTAARNCSRCAACSISSRADKPVPLDEVEPARESSSASQPARCRYGSISKEAHETLAIAMNRIGGKSNTGEGGEDPAASQPDANGDSRRQRHQAGGLAAASASRANTWSTPTNCRSRWPRAPSPAKAASCPAHKVDQ